jgi:hypothetical protein
MKRRAVLEIWHPIGCEQCQTIPNVGQNKKKKKKKSWQANPVFGGVAFIPMTNSLLKVTFFIYPTCITLSLLLINFREIRK